MPLPSGYPDYPTGCSCVCPPKDPYDPKKPYPNPESKYPTDPKTPYTPGKSTDPPKTNSTLPPGNPTDPPKKNSTFTPVTGAQPKCIERRSIDVLQKDHQDIFNMLTLALDNLQKRTENNDLSYYQLSGKR